MTYAPSHPLARAAAALREKRYDDALTELEAARRDGLDPGAPSPERGEYVALRDHAEYEMFHGLVLLERGDADGALARSNRAVGYDRTYARVWANRGWVRAQRREWTEALADYDEALRLDRRYVFALFRRAQCKVELGDLAGAERDLEGLLAIQPDDAEPRALYEEVRRQRGR